MFNLRHLAQLTATVAVALFALGVADPHAQHQRGYYSFGFLAALASATCWVLWSLERIVARTVAREAHRSRACLADAVAEALADELEARRNPPPRLTSVN